MAGRRHYYASPFATPMSYVAQAPDELGAYSEGEPCQMLPSSSQSSYHGSSARAPNALHLPAHLPPRPTHLPHRRSPPRAPRTMRMSLPDRDRSVTPPPPQSPSADYLALARQDPADLDDPSSLRKLLVLDLNGTLLLRSPRVKYRDRARDTRGNVLPGLRAVHPRPYMPAFRSYLFSDQTRAWLDVMVWSSAQPHSVEDMVDKCFGRDKEKLIAVWARDTLGLSSEHYFQKVQTVKDLAKPWSLLAPHPSASSSPHSSIASSPRNTSAHPLPPRPTTDDRPTPPSKISPQAHSALTTLLLDDSVRKAELQPFNHVCIGEYTAALRSKDVDSLQTEQDWRAALDARHELDALMSNGDAAAPTPTLAPSDSPAPQPAAPEDSPSASPPQEPSKKRKRKKLEKRAARLGELGESKPEVPYDDTLLAVVGVLDAIKAQANVAAWIRSGGLWGPRGPPGAGRSRPMLEVPRRESPVPDEDDGDEDGQGVQSDDSTLSVDKRKAKGRSAVSSEEGGKTRRREKKRKRMSAEEDVDLAPAENDDDAAAPPSSLPASQRTLVSEAEAAEGEAEAAEEEVEEGEGEAVQGMWFEDSEVKAYWVSRGRQALEELDIPIDHGLER
ncbi:hypothetical protein C8Q76DRAFT_790627 [Earliella scabrosa]|nr:hypothetical protein C8Q76DRAFT_790627 [Earliella scabrosa]